MVRGKGEKIFEAVCITLAALLALMCLYPLLYTLGVSLCSEAEWTSKNGLLILFPTRPTFIAYRKIFGVGSYVLKALGMSFLRTAVGTVTSVAVNALVGYVLSRRDFPGKNKYIYLLLFTIFFSGGLIPNYLVIKELHLLNNFWSMILPNIVSAWNILVFKQFFTGLPKEIEEAAIVDGTGEIKLFLKIVLPLSTPVVASIGLFTMVTHWNNWFDVMIYIDQAHSALWTLQYYIMINFNNLSQIDSSVIIGTGGVSQLTQRMALTIVGFLPILCIYPFFQKFFKDGVFLGAVKG
ncbi:MAG: carbohydrate ABC transporter permease [Clostridia bacterium]|jgi:putative aldouronate transport system permease protein|uniref:carbohydrate ABC transporter permease n=1 Tax=Pumilibacter muris TaxID=2941510 RepID=UPI00203D5279|nr:carbohydrate ABC transporter permease [Pumilibacter muris]MCI8596209.1 carbohydrate ABC transporter permease [Clostridia bacterium]